MTDSTRLHLQQVACIFASNNTDRPTTDHDSADIQSLYGGKGGIAANGRMVATSTCTEASLPPPYKESAPNKRRHKRKRECESSDIDGGRSSSPDMSNRSGIHKEICDMEERLRNYFKSELDDIRKELDGVKKRSRRFENSITNELDTFQSQHGEDELRARVEEFVQEKMDDHIVAVDEKFFDKEKDIEKNIEGLKQEMWENLNKNFDKRLRSLLKQELSNMRLHLSFDNTQ
ncbi:hypothetical protein V8C37DRAFT_398652 [Trichoderma ceciliae]